MDRFDLGCDQRLSVSFLCALRQPWDDNAKGSME
jgi:hypothetical protein